MLFSYLTSTVSSSDEGDIHDVWGYRFRWTDLHQTEDQLKPLLSTYDTVGEEVLERVHEQQKLRSTSNGTPETQGGGKEDLYEMIKAMALIKEDEVITKFWQDVHTVPEWVDWEQIKRGQDVYYRYGEATLIGLTFSSLLGGMGAGRIVETLARTGGFAPRVARKRLLETVQHTLQVTMSLESIQPGGEGHISSIRVRLLHAAVRKRILALAKAKPEYYDIAAFGTPINDQDTIGTISTFSAQLIWLALPAQGIYMRKSEIEDYIALWRLVAYYMGTPTDVLRTAESTKAYMDSVLEADIKPTMSSKVLANNIITVLADKPPTYPSADFLRAQARWLNGPRLSDALQIPESSYFSIALVVVQCLVVCFSSYLFREISFLDRWRINRMRKSFYEVFILGKDGLQGKKTKFELQYIPEYDTVTEVGEAERGLALGKPGSVDSKNLAFLILLVGIPLGLLYFWTKFFILFWGWVV